MRVFFNEDWEHFWKTRYKKGIEVNKQVLRDFILKYKDTSVTDFSLNVNATTSSTPTKFMDTWGTKYLKKEENGEAVDYSNTHATLWYDVFVRRGIDAYQIWIDTLKEIGVRPWLSIRMNDCHFNWMHAALLKSEEVEKHPDWWLAKYRNANGYFDKCFDYTVPEVRDRIFGYIKEQLERYDVYGLELDFTREPYCFPYGKQDRKIILSFMEKVKNLTLEIGEKRGKEIKISILCQANPINAYHNGFDLSEMTKRGIVDVVIASPRWHTTNTDIPIEIWKQLLGDKVVFGCMQQMLVKPTYFCKPYTVSADISFGEATANVARGAECIYLYNYMDMKSELEFNHSTSVLRDETVLFNLLKEIGDDKLREKHVRRIPITFDDFVNGYEHILSTLPMKISVVSSVRIPTGKITKNNQTYFIMQTEEKIEPNDLSIYLNGVKAEYVSEHKEDSNIVKGNVYSFALNLETETQIGVEICSDNAFVMKYAEILVE